MTARHARAPLALAANGFTRLVLPGDVKAGPWVSNLVDLQVFSATTVPAPTKLALVRRRPRVTRAPANDDDFLEPRR